MNKYIIIYGDPKDGFVYVGPFDKFQQATEYAEADGKTDWWVVELETPAEETSGTD